MPLRDCVHRPPCPRSATRFVCGQRTRIEDAVTRGLIAREAGETLLRKYGVPMSPMRRVVTGVPAPVVQETLKL